VVGVENSSSRARKTLRAVLIAGVGSAALAACADLPGGGPAHVSGQPPAGTAALPSTPPAPGQGTNPAAPDRVAANHPAPVGTVPLVTAEPGAQLAALAQTAPDMDNPYAGDEQLVPDPFEDWNRYVFSLNTLIYMFMQPVIAPYAVMPPERQANVDNFLHNVSTPIILLNDLLQGNTDRAWVTTQRFFVNSTAGGLGFFDTAEDMGLPKHSEDFGQTLGVWGVGDGPYMVYPLLGPSNPRDGAGRLVDMVTNPLFWLAGPTGELMADIHTYATVSSQLGGNVNRMEQIREGSLDYYAAIRSLYIQSRRAAIANQESDPIGSAPDMSDAETLDETGDERAARGDVTGLEIGG
jgi:phospholipid-binding lipoprotein MlaA